jgi:hypothetical protein
VLVVWLAFRGGLLGKVGILEGLIDPVLHGRTPDVGVDRGKYDSASPIVSLWTKDIYRSKLFLSDLLQSPIGVNEKHTPMDPLKEYLQNVEGPIERMDELRIRTRGGKRGAWDITGYQCPQSTPRYGCPPSSSLFILHNDR